MKNHANGMVVSVLISFAVLILVFFVRIGFLNIPGLVTDEFYSQDNTYQSVSVDLNAACTEDLIAIPGVGTALANRIIEYRERYGNYVATDELLNIQGMSKELYTTIEPYISLGGP